MSTRDREATSRSGRAACLAWLAFMALAAAEDRADANERWVSLFDGRTLDGWRAAENPASFSVEDGAIVVHGPRAHLFCEQPIALGLVDFEFSAEVQTDPRANSGIFFHTRWQESGWPEHGYEAQVNSSASDSIRTGSLYGVVKVDPAPHQDGAWFTYVIRVAGRRITLSVDGKVVTDYLEPLDVQGPRRLGQGTIALQAHDPESRVRFRALRVRTLPPEAARLTRADRVALDRDESWWLRMDYGPFLAATVGAPTRNLVALKGVTVALDEEARASVTFDTELLRTAFAWEGWLELTGVTYDGGHGGHPRVCGPLVFSTPNRPAWSTQSDHVDPRPTPHGPLPRSASRYRGFTRHGEEVVFNYTVGATDVLEHPALERHGGRQGIARTIALASGPRPALDLIVAEEPGRTWQVSADGQSATATHVEAAFVPDANAEGVVVVIDRTTGSFDELAMGAPSATDAADAATNPAATFRFADSHAPAHAEAGAVDGHLPRLHDGESPQDSDDVRRNVWFDGACARLVVDLGRSVEVQRIATYSWHVSNRAPQRYTLWASDGETPPATDGDLEEAGWRRVARVDTTGLGYGGKHGAVVASASGSLGHMRSLVFDLPSIEGGQGVFLGEIDIEDAAASLRPLTQPRVLDRRTLWAEALGLPAGARLEARGAVLALALPASSDASTFKLVLGRDETAPSAEERASWPKADDLAPLLAGGPGLWGEPITLDVPPTPKTEVPYTIDRIPIPFDNPWASNMRLAGLDFFADGTRAAVCTWNGDVWIVSGLGGETLERVTWRRFATGLFESLGLAIVGDVIHVHGRDQITRLHDLDGDGEADRYECFNNDVLVTENFHEFAFDLVTDTQGNFYFSKAAPVRPGGRGFDEILDHHGTVMKLSADGQKLEVYATGLRAPNGLAVSPTGQVTAGDNEGTWVPHCKLHWLSPGSFQGVVDTAHTSTPPATYNPPLCWFPMSVDNSSGGQVWVTSERFGPFTGQLLHLSYGQSSIYLVLRDAAAPIPQAFVVRLPVDPASGVLRARFNPRDGQLYVVGLRGWQTNAAQAACFERVRFTGHPVRLPAGIATRPGEIDLTFTTPLDPELATDPGSYAVAMWNYVWSKQYGSPEVSVLDPDPEFLERARQSEQQSTRVHDELEVSAARLSDDGRRVTLVVPKLAPAMQVEIKVDLESADHHAMVFALHGTIHGWSESQPPVKENPEAPK